MSKKRGNGEGSIYFDKVRKLWVAKVLFIDPATGKKRSRRQYAKTRTLADAKLDDMKADRKDGTLCAPSTLTVGAWFDAWLADIIKPTKRAATYACYEQNVRLHIKPAIGDRFLSDVNADILQRFYGDLARAGKSPRLRELIHAILFGGFKLATSRRHIGRNPCEDVRPPKVETREMTALTAEEAVKFMKAAEGDRLEALFVLALATGCRQGELLALQWGDIDLKAGTLSVMRTVVEIKGEFIVNPPKTKRGRRMVVIPSFGIEALKRHRVRMLSEGLAAADRLVFCREDGGYLSRKRLPEQSFARILKAAKVPTIRFHDLRHSAATLRFAAGDNPLVVQQLLGHARINTTLSVYGHCLPTMQVESAARFDRMISETGCPTVAPIEAAG